MQRYSHQVNVNRERNVVMENNTNNQNWEQVFKVIQNSFAVQKHVDFFNGKQVFLFDTELQQVTIRELSKSLGSSPAALLAGGEAVEKSFTLKNATRKDGLTWVLALPKDKESGFERVLLGFKADKLRKMELYDSFSHVTHITFDGVERNPTLQDATFLFTPPAGVDVVGE